MWHSILCHDSSYVRDLVPAHLVIMFAPGSWCPKTRVWQNPKVTGELGSFSLLPQWNRLVHNGILSLAMMRAQGWFSVHIYTWIRGSRRGSWNRIASFTRDSWCWLFNAGVRRKEDRPGKGPHKSVGWQRPHEQVTDQMGPHVSAGWAGGDDRDGPKTKITTHMTIHFFLFFSIFHSQINSNAVLNYKFI
jgi:hypothetical protein